MSFCLHLVFLSCVFLTKCYCVDIGHALFEQILCKFLQGFAPYLPFVVAWVGVETHLYPAVAHCLHDVAGVFDTRVLFATTHEEHVELLVESLGIGQHTRYLFLQVEV